MRREGKNRKGQPGRILRFLAFLLLAVFAAGAAAGDSEEIKTDNLILILAQDAAKTMDLKGPDGSALQVRSDLSAAGRGEADPKGNEPDYTGLIGYAVLPLDPEICRSPAILDAYWHIPLYRRSGDGTRMIRDGQAIGHKTPVIVAGQELEPDGENGYKGYLQIIRLDTRTPCILDVSCFVTIPYWYLPLTESADYGYGLAVYRETPGEGPREEDGSACRLRDGTKILIPYTGAVAGTSPRPETLKVQGILFSEDEPHVIYFRPEDLLPNY